MGNKVPGMCSLHNLLASIAHIMCICRHILSELEQLRGVERSGGLTFSRMVELLIHKVRANTW